MAKKKIAGLPPSTTGAITGALRDVMHLKVGLKEAQRVVGEATERLHTTCRAAGWRGAYSAYIVSWDPEAAQAVVTVADSTPKGSKEK